MSRHETQLNALEYVMRHQGHSPRLYIRYGRRTADALRCDWCGWVEKVNGQAVDEDNVRVCLVPESTTEVDADDAVSDGAGNAGGYRPR
jgi:hypothetical protein